MPEHIIGIDPSLTSTGISVVSEGLVQRTVRVRSKAKGHDRVEEILRAIYAEAEAVVAGGHAPPRVGIEGPAMMAKGSAVVQIFGLWGTITHQLWRWHLPYYVVPPTTLKKYITGRGNAGKDEVLAAAIGCYPEAGLTGNDVADATVIAAMGSRKYGVPMEPLTAYREKSMEGVEWSE